MKRRLVITYCRLRDCLGDPEQLSLRKQVCLQYLKWGYTSLKEDRDSFVELIKRWRKEDEKIGKHRTLLERKARKLFRKIAKHKKLAPSREGARKWCIESQKRKIGVFHPDYQKNLKEFNKKIRHIQMEKNLGPGTLDWIVTSPEGERFKIRNLAQFCREHNLDRGHMCKVANHPEYKHHKGWKCEKYSDEWGNL